MFDADNVVGADSVTLLFEDESLWSTTELGQGVLNFGMVFGECDPSTQGDLDGDGTVAFADFLVLSANFGQDVSDGPFSGDIDCSGSVQFADFLILSNSFGQAVGSEVSNVPEPSSFSLLLFACFVVLARTRWTTSGSRKQPSA